MNPEDEILLKKFQQNSTQKVAFEGIVRKYSRPLFSHICKYVEQREEIEDILQTVWIKVWKNLHTFRGESLLSTWLFTIATREYIVQKVTGQCIDITSTDNVLNLGSAEIKY